MPKPAGAVIRELRKARKLSLTALSVLSGVDRGTIGRIERGEQDPQPSTVRVIASSLGVSVTRIDPRLKETERATDIEPAGRGARSEDYLEQLIAHIKSLEGEARSKFIRAVVALLDALAHTRARAGSGSTENNDR